MNVDLKINPLQLIEKYYRAGSDIHHVLVKHSQDVTAKALEVAARHPEFELDIEFIAEAAMLHDIGIFMCDAPRIHCHGTHQYVEHGYLGANLLRTENLPRHALVCERHTGVGITLEMILHNQLPLPHRDMIPVSMEEKVICYADKFLSKTQLNAAHQVEQIRTYLSRYGESELTKFNEWHAMFE